MPREQVNEDRYVEDRSKLSVYIPKPKRGDGLLARMRTVGKKLDRSVNYLVVEAIREYVERHEKEET